MGQIRHARDAAANANRMVRATGVEDRLPNWLNPFKYNRYSDYLCKYKTAIFSLFGLFLPVFSHLYYTVRGAAFQIDLHAELRSFITAIRAPSATLKTLRYLSIRGKTDSVSVRGDKIQLPDF